MASSAPSSGSGAAAGGGGHAASAAAESTASATAIDMDLYSRQIGVFGLETMGQLRRLNVLIVGLKSVGVESAKNLVLEGAGSISLFDPTPVSLPDLGCNFCLRPEHVGRRRDEVCAPVLAALNPDVRVATLPKDALEPEDARGFDCVVVTDNVPIAEQERLDAFCRAQEPAIAFLACDVRGWAGRLFVDFGPAHTIRDPDGEPLRTLWIDQIRRGAKTVVECNEYEPTRLNDGDWVVFHDVQGMVELNDGVPRRVTEVRRHTFTIEEDSNAYGDFVHGSATAVQVHVPVVKAWDALAVRRRRPCPADDEAGLIVPDFSKFGRPEQLHIAFEAVDAWAATHGGVLPRPHDEAVVEEVVALAHAFVAAAAARAAEDAVAFGGAIAAEVDEPVVRQVARYAALEAAPLGAFYGGVVAQEVVKRTGKFTPIRQYLYLDAFEALPKDPVPAEEYAPSGGRYDHAVGLLGRPTVEKLQSRKVLFAGAGAIGGEVLKGMALWGVGRDATGGFVRVADPKRVQRLHLSRQVLLRREDVGYWKAECTVVAARALNEEVRAEAICDELSEASEWSIGDRVWEEADLVISTVDTKKAHQHVDRRCVMFRRPMVDSGLLGTKSNAQVVVPFGTETYEDGVDVPEECTPMDRIKSFPSSPLHCREWAEYKFDTLFRNPLRDLKECLLEPEAWTQRSEGASRDPWRRENLEHLLTVLRLAESATFDACVRQARADFHDSFDTQIRRLLHTFPPSHTVHDGQRFWRGRLRAPHPEPFDLHNNLHRAFIAHTAAIYALSLGIPLPDDFDSVARLEPALASVELPAFVPPSIREQSSEDEDEAVARLRSTVRALAGKDAVRACVVLVPEQDVDDDRNHHVDFLTATSNVRAATYDIPAMARHEVRLGAGRIVPSVASTASAIAGLVTIEALKVVDGRAVETLRNGFVNLGINVFVLSEPSPPKRTRSREMDPMFCGPVRAKPEGFSSWDRIVVLGDERFSIRALTEVLRDQQGVSVTGIFEGQNVLWLPTMMRRHSERTDRPLMEVYREVKGRDVVPGRRFVTLEVACEDPTDSVECEIPRVQFFFA